VSLVRQLRDFAVGAALAIVIATVAFVAVRNKELAATQIERADRGIEAVANDRVPLPDVHAVVVGAATPSPNHPYLRRRDVQEGATVRPLASGAGPDDKLFYDAANKIERLAADGKPAHFAILLPDGSGRALAARALAHDGAKDVRIAIAVTPPAHPAPYPLLVFIGLLGLGAALSAAGGLVGGGARFAGTFAGIATLAIPCVLWGAPVGATAIILVAAAFASLQLANLTDRFASGIRAHKAAMAFLAPAALSMFVLVAAPFIIGLVLGFYDHHHGEWSFVGLDNFGEILSGGGRPLDDPLNFWFILGVTVLWTLANVAMHVTIGVALALVLSRKWLRGRGVFRMLLILPWAVPNYITALIWKGMFTGEYGAINSLLHAVGLDGVSWFSSWASAFAANVATNTWLGFPFMMVVALGALETIPRELYEAASVDGASAWQRFRHITLPHLRPALGPAVALGSIWTFNMFNVIFLVSGGAPGGSTNILVTDAYRWAFERGERYGMAAAYATIIFLVLLLWTVFGTRIVRRKEAEA
jgi:ABC-type sugar transport system permease subunit